MSEIPDESQRRAIYAPCNQSVLVTSPPGYGKTFVMPRRIEFLIKSGKLIPPERALGLTFTNAAASEMLTRLQMGVSTKYLDYVDAMTFHSFSYRVLRAYGNCLGLAADFRILPEQEKRKHFKEFVEKQVQRFHESQWYDYSEWEKTRVLKLLSEGLMEEHSLFADFWQTHKAQQIARNEVDFNHLLWFATKLFRSHPEVLEIYRRVYRYILVDEFQDTNPIQFEILRLLVRGHDNQSDPKMPARPVFIFADDWQSIYGFLGAVPKEQISKAKELFHCQGRELTEDHRTASPALSLFGRILRKPETSGIEAQSLDIPLVVLSNPIEMAERVDLQASEWIASGIPLHEIAILARERKHLSKVQKVLSHDFLSVPDLQARGLEQNPVFVILTKLSIDQSAGYGSLQRILKERTQRRVLAEGEEYIRATLLDLAGNYDLRYPGLRLSERAKFMANEALLEINWGHQLHRLCKDRIFVGSLHSAKGLEFRAVAIVHLDQDSFPAWFFICRHCKDREGIEGQSMEERMEEEWRVFYVGVTRARKHLALFSSACSFDRYGREHLTPVTCLVGPPIWNYLDIVDCRDHRAQANTIRCMLRDELRPCAGEGV